MYIFSTQSSISDIYLLSEFSALSNCISTVGGTKKKQASRSVLHGRTLTLP